MILPCSTAPKGTKAIVSAEDIPEWLVTWKQKYAEMDPKAYSYIKTGQSKMVKGCFTMGFNVEAKSCIAKVNDDLRRMGVYITSKPVQKLETDSSMAFLGVLIDTDQNVVKQLVDDVLRPLKLELMKEDPVNFPIARHGRSK